MNSAGAMNTSAPGLSRSVHRSSRKYALLSKAPRNRNRAPLPCAEICARHHGDDCMSAYVDDYTFLKDFALEPPRVRWDVCNTVNDVEQLKTRSDTTLGHKEGTVAVSSGEVDHGPIMVSSHVSQIVAFVLSDPKWFMCHRTSNCQTKRLDPRTCDGPS